jgi:epoxyqueuosine reductase QueG
VLFIFLITIHNENKIKVQIMLENNNWVKEILRERNLALIGFADLSDIDMNYEFKYGISIAIALKRFPSITDEPSKEYYDEYNRVSTALRETSAFLENKIKEHGFKAFSLAGVKQNEEYRTPLPFKTLATRAGLGWIGKSATLVTKQFGNAIRLNGVLTDMPLETGIPVISSLCGDCVECVKNCYGKAIAGNSWNLSTDRDNLLNAYDCKKAVIERGKIWGVTEGSCGVCISVCPYTKNYISNNVK